MSEFIIKEVNAETGEEIIREMTTQEKAQFVALQEAAEAKLAEERIKAEQIADLKLSARAKLASLGLSVDEIDAIVSK